MTEKLKWWTPVIISGLPKTLAAMDGNNQYGLLLVHLHTAGDVNPLAGHVLGDIRC